MRHFLKKVDLYLKNLDLCAWFSEKNGAQPKNVDIYASISEKLGPQHVKMGVLRIVPVKLGGGDPIFVTCEMKIKTPQNG